MADTALERPPEAGPLTESVGSLGAAALDLVDGAKGLYSVFVRTLYYVVRGRRE